MISPVELRPLHARRLVAPLRNDACGAVRERPVLHPPVHEHDQLLHVAEATPLVRLHLGDPPEQARGPPQVGVPRAGTDCLRVAAEVDVRVQGEPALLVCPLTEVVIELAVGAGAAYLDGAAAPPAASAYDVIDRRVSETGRDSRGQKLPPVGLPVEHHASPALV